MLISAEQTDWLSGFLGRSAPAATPEPEAEPAEAPQASTTPDEPPPAEASAAPETPPTADPAPAQEPEASPESPVACAAEMPAPEPGEAEAALPPPDLAEPSAALQSPPTADPAPAQEPEAPPESPAACAAEMPAPEPEPEPGEAEADVPPTDPADPESNMGRGSDPSGAASSGDTAALPRTLLGMPQREQASDNMAKMSPADQQDVMALLTTAASHSPDEAEYIVKAMAAGHSLAELKQFHAQIAGKDPAWLDQHLRLVGGSTGTGIKQQWSHSCAPTEVEAMKGELDPIYAFGLRQKNPALGKANDKDGNAVNPDLANEQAHLLTQTRGVVAPRENADGSGRGGKMSTLLNSEGAGMGMTFERREVGADITMDEALSTAQEKLKRGLPVPISVGDDGNPYAHAAMLTGVDDGPPRRFSIHDPWTGNTKTYSEDDIKNGKLDVGSCKKLAAIYPPSPK